MADPKNIHDIDTPAVLVDLDRAIANIAHAQAHADAHGIKLRPHIKTHKLPFFAKMQQEAGAVGITCQKLGEAEVMADSGLTDIFLPYNILGEAKLARLMALHRRITISVTVDNDVSLAGLSSMFTDASHPLKVLVECDTGMGRCGVQSPGEALALAKKISAAPGLRFGGLMTYPAAGGYTAAEAWLGDAVALLCRSGLQCETVSSGGSPDLWHSGGASVITEYRPGTYIYLDRYQVAQGVGALEDCALTVLSTVVSRPTTDRAILDAGSKALTSDTLGMTGFGILTQHPEALISGLSEEHGTVALNGANLAVGDRVRILPNHACVVSNLFDEVHLISGDQVIDIIPVAARGRVS
jgi:D-serine deaminase-like pyridoxal phosphate-dependent protein